MRLMVRHPQEKVSLPAKAGNPVFRSAGDEPQRRGVLDAPLEPVIGLAGGETRWRGMTSLCVRDKILPA